MFVAGALERLEREPAELCRPLAREYLQFGEPCCVLTPDSNFLSPHDIFNADYSFPERCVDARERKRQPHLDAQACTVNCLRRVAVKAWAKGQKHSAVSVSLPLRAVRVACDAPQTHSAAQHTPTRNFAHRHGPNGP